MPLISVRQVSEAESAQSAFAVTVDE
jgi:hypothetical protein